MATYNETIRPTSIELVDQNGNKTYPTGDFTINAFVKSNNSYDKTYKFANFVYNLAASSFASSKKLKNQGNTTIYWKSKSITVIDTPDRGGYPSGSAEDALLQISGGEANWDKYIASYGDAEYRFLTSTLPKDLQVFDGVSISQAGLSGNVYASTIYTATASATFAGLSDSTHGPSRSITWEDIVPVVSGMTPSAGAFVDETQAKTFNWTIGNVTAYDGTSVLGTSIFKWRQNGTTHTVAANATSVTIPANTFGNGTVEWCVVHTTADGLSNAESWQTITTQEDTPLAPTELSPKSEVVDGNIANVFSWHHNISTGSPQTKADLEYSTNGSTWSTLATVTGPTESITIAAGTLPSGNVQWRVRTYNTDNAAGPYSDATIIVKARPNAPSIESITGSPLARVTWSASDQVGYVVSFTDADGNVFTSGERYGSANSFQAPGLLSIGSASCTVSVANNTGLWNSTTIQFTVSNSAAGAITLEGEAVNGMATLIWSSTITSPTSFYVLKNGEPIAKTYGNRYEDKTANGIGIYEIVYLYSNGTYVRSNSLLLTTSVMGAQLFDFENDGELIDLFVRRNNLFELKKSKTAATSYYVFAGNTFPTAYTEYKENETISFTITRENNDCEAIYGLLGALCCIKDKSGSVAFGVLDSVGSNADRYTDIDLSFTRVEREGVVTYE